MKLKSKKSALLLSFTSLLLCFAMLAGSTFAWFTDTATTGVNKITSGNLHVEIQNEAGTKIEKLEWVTKEGTAIDNQDDILWEPGCTYLLTPFKIVNTGNLALKYKIVITGLDGDSPLLDVIKFTYKNEAGNELDISAEGHLAANGGSTGMITVSAHMDETANNDYQDKTLENVKFTVYATQDTVENDSFNNTYDENATYYPVLDAAGLKDALVNGGNIKVDNDVDTGKDVMAVTKDTTLDMNGKTIKNTEDIWTGKGEDGNWSLISARNGANLTITGNGTFKAKENDAFTVDVQNGSTVTIKNGTFISNVSAVYVTEGTAIIEGGHFSIQQLSDFNDCRYLLNCLDKNYNKSAKIIVKGGTFVNYDPSHSDSENPQANFVADGYSVISEQHGADTWYTVVKGTGVVAGSQDELNKGITDSETKDVTVVMPANSSVTLDNDIANDGDKARDITFVGDGSQTVDIHTDDVGENGNKLNYQRGSTFTFENLTVTAATSGNYEGIVCDGLTYKNCTIKGIQWLYAENVEFINCKFIQENDDTYHLWTYGAKNVTFTDCEFSSTSKSKAVLCYTDAENGKTYTRTFNNCTFRATGEAEKSAIMINPSAYSNVNTYVININNCTATGYAENGISGQTIVGVKETVKDTITVNINGKTVYTH